MTLPVKDTSRFVETEIEDETVLMLLESGIFFSMSGTAQAIWRLIDGERGTEAIVQALAGDYQISAAQIAAEVDDFLAELEAADVLRRS